MERLIEIGLSGWIFPVITVLLGGGIVYHQVTRRRTRQSKIRAGGNVAGGDILKDGSSDHSSGASSTEFNSVQRDVRAGGDVAGGNIVRNDK
jgi:hypothetical protein